MAGLESFGERINLKVLPGAGLAFCDFDAVRRLNKLGFKIKKSIRRTTTKDRVQREFLRGRKIRDLDHYRALVEDPRSSGPVHWYSPGANLLMQRTVSPKRGTVYYMILDTAIGCAEVFITDLLREKRVLVEAAATEDHQ